MSSGPTGSKALDDARAALKARSNEHIFKASTKMFCCDIEHQEWRSIALPNPEPSARELAIAQKIFGSDCILLYLADTQLILYYIRIIQD